MILIWTSKDSITKYSNMIIYILSYIVIVIEYIKVHFLHRKYIQSYICFTIQVQRQKRHGCYKRKSSISVGWRGRRRWKLVWMIILLTVYCMSYLSCYYMSYILHEFISGKSSWLKNTMINCLRSTALQTWADTRKIRYVYAISN